MISILKLVAIKYLKKVFKYYYYLLGSYLANLRYYPKKTNIKTIITNIITTQQQIS